MLPNRHDHARSYYSIVVLGSRGRSSVRRGMEEWRYGGALQACRRGSVEVLGNEARVARAKVVFVALDVVVQEYPVSPPYVRAQHTVISLRTH